MLQVNIIYVKIQLLPSHIVHIFCVLNDLVYYHGYLIVLFLLISNLHSLSQVYVLSEFCTIVPLVFINTLLSNQKPGSLSMAR